MEFCESNIKDVLFVWMEVVIYFGSESVIRCMFMICSGCDVRIGMCWIFFFSKEDV